MEGNTYLLLKNFHFTRDQLLHAKNKKDYLLHAF